MSKACIAFRSFPQDKHREVFTLFCETEEITSSHGPTVEEPVVGFALRCPEP